MKCLSLWQPWASLVVLGTKKIETRSWPTNYRGPLLIHAAKKRIPELIDLVCWDEFQAALWNLAGTMEEKAGCLPFGEIIGRVELIDCRPTESFNLGELHSLRYRPGREGDLSQSWTENDLGNFEPGRFGWVFENPKYFAYKIPYRGKQGLFDVPEWED